MTNDAEFIVVCIDNSRHAFFRETHEAQFKIVKQYCRTKLAANRETEVVLFTMGSNDFRSMLRPTSDYKKILDYLPSIFIGAGILWFESALSFAPVNFCRCPPNKQKRMLFLVGGPVDMNHMEAVKHGSELKDLDIAVDVVNFYLGKRPKNTMMELDAFVEAANSNHYNSHIEHVEPRHLKKAKGKNHFIIRKIPRLSRKANHHKKAKGKNHAAGDNEHVQTEALSLENEVVKLGKRKRQSRQSSMFKLF